MTQPGQSYSYGAAWLEADRHVGNLGTAIRLLGESLEKGDIPTALYFMHDAETRIADLRAHLEERV